MFADQLRIDFSRSKTPLSVRQALAVALGLLVDREFTWEMLREQLCDLAKSKVPNHILIVGLPHLAVTVPEEYRSFLAALRDLEAACPDIDVQVQLFTDDRQLSIQDLSEKEGALIFLRTEGR